MHELSLMQSIFEIVEDGLKKHELVYVNQIKLKVGELAAVQKEAMQFAFSVLQMGTVLEGARLEIEYVPAEAYCAKCEHRYRMIKYRVICPLCGNVGQIVSGKELYVESLEVNDGERDQTCTKCTQSK